MLIRIVVEQDKAFKNTYEFTQQGHDFAVVRDLVAAVISRDFCFADSFQRLTVTLEKVSP